MVWNGFIPRYPLAHPMDDGTVVTLDRSIDQTCQQLGVDGESYKMLIQPLVNNWEKLAKDILGPLHIPQHPLLMLQFALHALRSSSGLSTAYFKELRARSLFAGLSAHSILPLNQPLTAAFGLILGALGHVVGWPFPKGGSQKIADALTLIFSFLWRSNLYRDPHRTFRRSASVQTYPLRCDSETVATDSRSSTAKSICGKIASLPLRSGSI